MYQILPRLTANFRYLCPKYQSHVSFAVNNVSKNKKMRTNINKYIDFQHKVLSALIDTRLPSIQLLMDVNIYYWLLSIHKLQQIKYQSMDPLDFEDFINEYEKQMEFSHKIYPIVGNIDFRDNQKILDKYVHNYADYLAICKNNPKSMVVPSLTADFVLHSHMLDNDCYVKDTNNIFGRILDHKMDIDIDIRSIKIP